MVSEKPLMAAGSLNRLAHEKSPYLLQHAANPVDWYAWGPEAFERASAEDKPIFLSVGYSTCHWCHVMAHESFEDPNVAALLNDTFVSIKVDREERPDIDGIYMTVCQMLTGGGGWPLTIIMTPEKEPFFAATYVPKESRFGRVGMLDLIPRIDDIWQTRRAELVDSAGKITSALSQGTSRAAGDSLEPHLLSEAFDQLASRFDEENGGFGPAPKFPTPHNLLFLLRYWKETRDPNALRIVERTLDAMRCGGIYDHIGFGFHRYSTDAHWLVPHFEKMLYDQAMLVMAFTEAYQATGKEAYARTVREVLTYVMRDMTDPVGGFHSAEDADSEGVEGKFYVWTESEIREVLDAEAADLMIGAFNVTQEGNYLEEATQRTTGENILHLREPVSDPETAERLELARLKLFDHRESRVRPHKDDKILTDWNGLMIAALAKGAQALGEPEYAEAATKAADFILSTMMGPDGRLLHRYRDGDAAVEGFADDYAFMIWGLLELYEATFEVRCLRAAIDLNGHLLDHFWDVGVGGFFASPDDGEQLLIRARDVYDGAVPSGNSVAMLNLLRLARITGDAGLEERAEQLGRAFSQEVGKVPVAYTQLLCALDFAMGRVYEVVIAGKTDGEDTRIMLGALRRAFLPNKVVLLNPAEQESPEIHRVADFARGREPMDGKATAYVCHNYNCKLPTTDVAGMLALFEV